MGLTGSILRKSKLLSFKETKIISAEILRSLNYRLTLLHEDTRYCSISVNKKDDDIGFVMYIYGKVREADEYNFSYIASNITRVIDIEDISECEDMILMFLKEYFKYYPNDYFDNELDWYYTKKDIDEAFKNKNFKEWCYEPPN
ncbi:MAG: hypothetical protein K2J32_09520 [Ruminococcus sp.]|nr:hypothetical protein [Ruminococcus sp.]